MMKLLDWIWSREKKPEKEPSEGEGYAYKREKVTKAEVEKLLADSPAFRQIGKNRWAFNIDQHAPSGEMFEHLLDNKGLPFINSADWAEAPYAGCKSFFDTLTWGNEAKIISLANGRAFEPIFTLILEGATHIAFISDQGKMIVYDLRGFSMQNYEFKEGKHYLGDTHIRTASSRIPAAVFYTEELELPPIKDQDDVLPVKSAKSLIQNLLDSIIKSIASIRKSAPKEQQNTQSLTQLARKIHKQQFPTELPKVCHVKDSSQGKEGMIWVMDLEPFLQAKNYKDVNILQRGGRYQFSGAFELHEKNLDQLKINYFDWLEVLGAKKAVILEPDKPITIQELIEKHNAAYIGFINQQEVLFPFPLYYFIPGDTYEIKDGSHHIGGNPILKACHRAVVFCRE